MEAVVFAWGAGEDGQLGLPEAPDGSDEWHVPLPTPVAALDAAALRQDAWPLVCGSRQSLALLQAGGLLCWGWNEKQSLGLGSREAAKEPTRVEALAEERVKQARRASAAHLARSRAAGGLGRLARAGGDGGGADVRLARRPPDRDPPAHARAGAATRTCRPPAPPPPRSACRCRSASCRSCASAA